MVGLLFIFLNICVDSHMYTNEEHCALCWINKKIVFKDEITENQRGRGGFYWTLVFDYSFFILGKKCLILVD